MDEKSQSSEQATITADNETYKPKTIPFTSNLPIPVPPPKEFQKTKAESSEESHSSQTPFRVTKKEEAPKPQPSSMTFEPKPQPESLVDYMPQTIIPKKELKRLAKEKKKQAKEKAKIEKEKKNSEQREKQGELFEVMMTSKKSKKEKKLTDEGMMPEQISTQVPQNSERSSLFQTLTQRTEENSEESSVSFVPFTATKKVDEEEKSKLRIIPNVADIDRNFTSFTANYILSFSSRRKTRREEKGSYNLRTMRNNIIFRLRLL